MPCVFRFCAGASLGIGGREGGKGGCARMRAYVSAVTVVSGWLVGRWGMGLYVIVDRPEDLLGRYEQTGHLPYCHLEVHLRELE